MAALSDKNAIMQIIGCLLKNPMILTDTKYILTKNDFDLPLAKTLFDGKLTKEILLDILKEEDISDIHILPSMYIEDPRISAKTNVSKSNVIIGNKYNYGYNYNNGTYSYNLDYILS